MESTLGVGEDSQHLHDHCFGGSDDDGARDKYDDSDADYGSEDEPGFKSENDVDDDGFGDSYQSKIHNSSIGLAKSVTETCRGNKGLGNGNTFDQLWKQTLKETLQKMTTSCAATKGGMSSSHAHTATTTSVQQMLRKCLALLLENVNDNAQALLVHTKKKEIAKIRANAAQAQAETKKRKNKEVDKTALGVQDIVQFEVVVPAGVMPGQLIHVQVTDRNRECAVE
jgi:hypothetical protein